MTTLAVEDGSTDLQVRCYEKEILQEARDVVKLAKGIILKKDQRVVRYSPEQIAYKQQQYQLLLDRLDAMIRQRP